MATGASKAKGVDLGGLDEIFGLAEYEIQHDAYRGLFNLDVPSPWLKCHYSDQDLGKVSKVCRTACPSLLRWTAELDALVSRRKKRKRSEGDEAIPVSLGRRGRHSDFRCPCDHNPFCLASLGGVMDDFLSEVAQEMLVSNKKTDITEEDDGCVIITPAAGEGKEIDAILVDDDQKQSGNKLESNCGDLSNLVRMDDETVHEAGENLFLRNWIPAEAFLHDNAFDPDDLDATKDTCIYSKSTREELRAIRKQTLVDCEPICDYVEHILLANADSSVALDDYFARLRGLHDSMLFFNPQKEDSSPSVNKIRMAVPPGIKNLGATCYLNTQIQCLARNTGLLEGIFAWKTPEVRSRMDSVLEKLQQLLARLAYGADSTISTEAFSQALGLQNDEMQDPNEFARLLFDRMHEAFQRCAHHESGNADNNTKSLSTLLPKLFMGVMTYETRCVNCRRVTERNERFMDINLPIVNKCDKPTNKKNEQLKIDEAFAAGERGEDTDVQYCLDSYMCPEDLSGDNMYFCSSCGEKRNASRCVVLNELPPVLNLQLCRYVYDREKQTKKKLSDRVLLSRVLQVRSRLGSTPKVYRLCAVMKHLGSSAYRGHYIAEAMDWQTGVWFEFNDQVVNILNSGPSCSTDDESEAAGFSAKKSEKKKGSQDAYNMYYVSEKFLSKCALNSLGLGVSPLVSSVAKQVETERKSRYDMVRDMCCNDANASGLMRRRKRGLLALLHRTFRPEGSFVRFGESIRSMCSESHVWVDGFALRSFFSCSTDESRGTARIPNGPLSCDHGSGLHPAIARCGKLLRREFVKELMDLLRLEDQFSSGANISKQEHSKFSLNEVAADLIRCSDCADAYRDNLNNKLTLFRALHELYEDLDPKKENSIDFTDENVYAISKKFVASFRGCIETALENLVSSEISGGGLDSVDAPPFLLDSLSRFGDLDFTVNSSIVCDYGKCFQPNKRKVRFVPERLWKRIRFYFPNAITLRTPDAQFTDWKKCDECKGSSKETQYLESWATQVTSGMPLSVLTGRRKNGKVVRMSRLGANEVFRLVHGKDIKRLWDAIKLARSADSNDPTSIKQDLVDKLFLDSSEVAETDFPEVVVKSWSPVSLLCSEHCLVLSPLILSKKSSSSSEIGGQCWEFNDDVVLLPSGEYRHLVLVTLKMYGLLFTSGPEAMIQDPPDSDVDILVDYLKAFHPYAQFQQSCLPSDSAGGSWSLLSCFLGTSIVTTKVMPELCADQSCNLACLDDLASGRSRKCEISSGSGLSLSHDDNVRLIDLCDPSVEDSEIELVSLRVLEIEQEAHMDKVIESLVKQTEEEYKSVRRSGRKRKQRYRVGPVVGEITVKIRREHNVAAVRLHIYESDSDCKLDQPLTFLLLGSDIAKLVESNTEARNIEMVVPFDWNNRVVAEVIADVTEELELDQATLNGLLEKMIIIRRSNRPALSKRKSVEAEDNSLPTELLVDSLLQIANLDDEKRHTTDSDKNNCRKIERGFAGTFLHGAVQNPSEGKPLPSERVPSPQESAHEQKENGFKDNDVLSIEDSEDEGSASVSFFGSSSSKKEGCNPDNALEKSEGICGNSKHGLVLEGLVKVVAQSLGKAETLDDSKCLEAVTWACNVNSANTAVTVLTDSAYAKYLEVAMSGSK